MFLRHRTTGLLVAIWAAVLVSQGPVLAASEVRTLTFTGGDHGAIELAADNRAASCDVSDLRSQFWTSLPAMAVELSGVTITNTSATTCALPESVTSAVIVGMQQQVVRSRYFRSTNSLRLTSPWPSAHVPADEFVSTRIAPSKSGGSSLEIVLGMPAELQISPLALRPDGRAVLVLDTDAEPDASGRPVHCVDVPTGGGLRLDLGATSLFVPVPTMPAPAGREWDPSGSAFYECDASLVSPFITWQQAVELVGPGGTNLPDRDNVIWRLAP